MMSSHIDSLEAEIERLKNDRRERIATAAMHGRLAGRCSYDSAQEGAKDWLENADALIKALDAKEEQS
jgi:transcription elongation GreA/GreB family factor